MALNHDYVTYLGIMNTICAIFIIVISIFASSRHRAKKTPITKTLLQMYACYIVSILTALVSVLFDLFDISTLRNMSDLEILRPDNQVLVLAHTIFFQINLLFLMPAIYYMFVFARFVFIQEEQKGAILVYFVKIMAIIAIILQFLAIVLLLSSIIPVMLGASIDVGLVSWGAVWVPLLAMVIFLVFTFIVAIPILIGAIEGWHRIPVDDPHRSNFLYLAIMAALVLLMIGFAILETILLENGVSYPNLGTLFMWTPALVLQYAAYRGFFSHKSTNS